MEDTTTQSAPPLVDQAKEQVHQAVEQGKQAVQHGKEMAGGLLDKAREQVKTQLVTQKDNAASGLNDVAEALSVSSSHLQEHGQEAVAQLGDRAAEKITQFSGYLREHDLDDVVHEVESFARRQPELFIGAAVLLGLVAARFLKSSAPISAANAMAPRPSGQTNGSAGNGTYASKGYDQPKANEGRQITPYAESNGTLRTTNAI